MPEYIPRKWEWIAQNLDEQKLTHLADIARKFDKFLNEKYEMKATHSWNVDYMKLYQYTKKLEDVLEVAEDGTYCVACDIEIDTEINQRTIDPDTCPLCLFKDEFGICSDEDSDYQDFIVSLKYAIDQMEESE